MKAIKNTYNDIEVSFEGYTYKFPKDKIRLVEDNLYEHIKGIWQTVFDNIKLDKKKQYIKPKKTKTPSFIQPEKQSTYNSNDMRVTEAGHQRPTFGDGTPASGTIDKDGVEWYGETTMTDSQNRKVT